MPQSIYAHKRMLNREIENSWLLCVALQMDKVLIVCKGRCIFLARRSIHNRTLSKY